MKVGYTIISFATIGKLYLFQGEFPHQVSLRIRGIFGTVKHYCGGSILKKNVVLTAAHCILNRLPPFTSVEVIMFSIREMSNRILPGER